MQGTSDSVLVCEQLPVRLGRRGTCSKQLVVGTVCRVLLSCTVLVRTTTHGAMQTVGAKDIGRERWMSIGIVREALCIVLCVLSSGRTGVRSWKGLCRSTLGAPGSVCCFSP